MTEADGVNRIVGSNETARAIYRAIADVVLSFENVKVVASTSQIAFRARRGFAYVWNPGRYLTTDVPLVLSIALGAHIRSTRIKEAVHPSRAIWMHHIELREATDVDTEVADWLRRAWLEAQ